MKTLSIFLDDALKYDKEYFDKLDIIHETEELDKTYTSNVVCNKIIQQIKELNVERDKKIKADMEKMTSEEKEKMLTYVHNQTISIYTAIKTLNEEMNDINKQLENRYLIKTRVKNIFYPIDYDQLMKQKEFLTSDLQHCGIILSKLNELMFYFHAPNPIL